MTTLVDDSSAAISFTIRRRRPNPVYFFMFAVVVALLSPVSAQPGGDESNGCTLCFNGSEPLLANDNIIFENDQGSGETCQSLLDAARQVNATNDKCLEYQELGALYCECPLRPSNFDNAEPLCDLCPDGSLPAGPNRMINDNAGSITCRDLFLDALFANIDTCQDYHGIGMWTCGCPVPLEFQDGTCPLCTSGDIITSSQDSGIDASGTISCQDVANWLAYDQGNNPDPTRCAAYQNTVGPYCGCSATTTEQGLCRICGSRQLEDPSTVIDDVPFLVEDQVTCGRLELVMNLQEDRIVNGIGCSVVQDLYAGSCCEEVDEPEEEEPETEEPTPAPTRACRLCGNRMLPDPDIAPIDATSVGLTSTETCDDIELEANGEDALFPCSVFRGFFENQCCPPPEPDPVCTLCAGGEEPTDSAAWEDADGVLMTCRALNATVATFSESEILDGTCAGYQELGAIYCGCETRPEISGCTICFDGSLPQDPNATWGVTTDDTSTTCYEQVVLGAISQQDETCEEFQRLGMLNCGCPVSSDLTEACPICPGGNDLIPEGDSFIQGKTCQDLANFVAFEAGLSDNSESTCTAYQQVLGLYCSCPDVTVDSDGGVCRVCEETELADPSQLIDAPFLGDAATTCGDLELALNLDDDVDLSCEFAHLLYADDCCEAPPPPTVDGCLICNTATLPDAGFPVDGGMIGLGASTTCGQAESAANAEATTLPCSVFRGFFERQCCSRPPVPLSTPAPTLVDGSTPSPGPTSGGNCMSASWLFVTIIGMSLVESLMQ